MSVKSKLKYSLKSIFIKDNYGSFASKHDRQKMILRFASDLIELGYKLPNFQNVKRKHVEAVVSHWKEKELTNATIKNRLSALRHLTSRFIPSREVFYSPIPSHS